MRRIGIVELRTAVRTAATITGLDLKLQGDPVPPHKVILGDRGITPAGTSTQVHDALALWLDGWQTCDSVLKL